jgi:hypothetical protein
MAAACKRLLVLPLLLLAVACASGGASGDPDSGGGDDDAPDSGGMMGMPDAGGMMGTPDAGGMMGTPDAGGMMGTPDAGPTCTPCQLVAQCGCDPGEACDLGGANPAQGTTECRPVTVQGMETSTCNGVTACAPGFTCLGPAGEASCKEWCASDAQCGPGAGGLCTVQVYYNNMPIPGAKVCSPSCNPLTHAGCPSGWGCHVYYNDTEARNFTWCTATGAGGQGAMCTDDTDCQQGFGCFCTDASCTPSLQKCLKTCNQSAGGTGCPAGKLCFSLNPAAVIGGIEYGVCN